ncbi:mitochondrial pyruvate carrier 4-like [Pseudomyrmex gracilis]|uniref:mitochondrial pyruvate carrier 4-like n=1 Tax=Pseudomyrmex gracilis TaxID=219809 RepID=UPI000995A972|nr:mitochondrial pyruvate carrier 4-like [Pseudomyrmex gracilis]
MSVIYKNSMNTIGKFVPEKLQPLWKHPAGPQTIFFWAPAFKWGLVIAGLGDLQRPANKISVSQSCALGITGLIWTRYSLAIIPKNWNLFSVNLFVACTAIYQVARALRYQRQQAALEAAAPAVASSGTAH